MNSKKTKKDSGDHVKNVAFGVAGVAEMGVHVNLLNNNLALPLNQARFMSQVNSKKEFKVSLNPIQPPSHKRV